MQSLLLVIASSRLDTKSSFLAKRSSFRQNLKVVSASNLKPGLQMLCLVHSLLNILETPHQCILLHEVRVKGNDKIRFCKRKLFPRKYWQSHILGCILEALCLFHRNCSWNLLNFFIWAGVHLPTYPKDREKNDSCCLLIVRMKKAWRNRSNFSKWKWWKCIRFYHIFVICWSLFWKIRANDSKRVLLNLISMIALYY